MQATARAKWVRVPPRKARLVVDLIRGAKVDEAQVALGALTRNAARIVEKVLASAVANATERGMNEDELVVLEARVNEGMSLKRYRPRAQGRATPILKRTSHIDIVLGDGSD